MQPHPAALADLEANWAVHAHKYLGRGRHYPDFLRFFQNDIDRRGWRPVVADFIFDDTPKAVDMLGRLFAGLLHPMIQLMYGIEWEQPAVVAEGLAQAAVHDNRLGLFLARVDEAVAARPADEPPRSVAAVCEALRREHPGLAASARWADPNRITDGVLARAPDEALALLASIRVGSDDVEERTVEMLHATAYLAAAASWNPPYEPKFDFFLMYVVAAAAARALLPSFYS